MSAFCHTEAQVEAITTLERNLIVLASAGTGKTYVLVRRFLEILEHEDWPVSSIVALTFTKLAAQEMRVRILQEVNDRKQKAGASSVWHRRAEELSQLQVSTVHSFCERVLRQYAVEAEIDPDFTVIGDDDVSLLREQAIDLTFMEMAEAEENWLQALPRYTRSDLQHTLRHAFAKRSTLHYVLSHVPKDEISRQEAWQLLVQKEMKVLWQQYQNAKPELAEAMDWLVKLMTAGQEEYWDAEDKLGQQMGPTYQAFQAIKQQNWTAAVEILDLKIMARIARGAKSKWAFEATLECARQHVKPLVEALRFLRKEGFSSQADPQAPNAAKAIEAWLQVWEIAKFHYQQLKMAQQGLDYDDLEILTLGLLQRGVSKPESRLGRFVSSIQQVLADEHQDINPIQQQIIDALAPIETPGKLFVVGDTKQSIYRFRQAQVTAFSELAVNLRELTGHAETTLDLSFRTHRNLVAGTNLLFKHVLSSTQGHDYASFEAKPLPLSSKRLPPPQLVAPVELHIVQKLESDLSGFDLKQDEVRVIANRLIQIRNAGIEFRIPDQTGLPDDERRSPAFQWKDAAILLRSSGDVEIFETVFRAAQIPYQVVAEVPLQTRMGVRSLLALLKHLHRPTDDFNLAVALRSPLFGIDDESLYWLQTRLQGAGLPLSQFAEISVPVKSEQADRLAQAAQILEDLYPRSHTTSPEQLVQRTLELTGLLETCIADTDRYRGSRHLEEIKAFQAYLRAEQHRPLGELLRRCTELGITYQHAAESGPAEEGRVQIMTIHKSKGLEFPVVFVPQLNRNLRGGGNGRENPMLFFDPEFGLVCQLRDEQGNTVKPRSHWAAKNKDTRMGYAEMKRVLYVACTRAADLLVLTATNAKKTLDVSGKKSDQGYSQDWLSEVLAAYQLEESAFEVDNPHIVTRSDGETDFKLRCAGHMAGSIELLKLEEPIATPGHSNEYLSNPTVLSQPLNNTVEDFRQIDQESREQRLGTFIHDLITQWDIWISKSPDELRAFIESRLREHDLGDSQVEAEALTHLTALRSSPLAKVIDAAPVKHWEVPVTLRKGDAVKHRRIDLLYQDADGNWHIVDWKTGRSASADLPNVTQYLGNLATYALAIEQLLGQYPEVSLCFLSPEIRVVPVSRQDLSAVRPT